MKRYKIGEFAKISHVTARMLRYYDKCGLLVPEHVDERNGSRYYDLRQIDTLLYIRSLLSMGFNVDEIKRMPREQKSEEVLLVKRQKYQSEIQNIQEKIGLLDLYKNMVPHKESLRFWIEVKDFSQSEGYSREIIGTRKEAFETGMELLLKEGYQEKENLYFILYPQGRNKNIWKLFIPRKNTRMERGWTQDKYENGQKAVFMFLGFLNQVDELYQTARKWENEMRHCNSDGIYEEYYCVNENLEFTKSGQIFMELRFSLDDVIVNQER